GIAVHPDFDYLLVDVGGERYILAEGRLGDVMTKKGIVPVVIKKFKGTELEDTKYSNPLVERVSRIILADFVSSEEGTGCVHIAPGHGEDDYYAGLKNNLDILSPVDEKGRFTEEVKQFAGMRVFDADRYIIEALDKKGALFYQEELVHSYPHCWRCKSPVIFKSTTQWFLKIDHKNLRDAMIEEIEKVQWVPPEGKNRISSMVKLRPDWCLSRQRLWGVVIPVFYCNGCSKAVITKETISSVESLVRQYGSDVWLAKSERELLPEGFACPYCGGKDFRKEKDILDVWFDSGVSHLAVLKQENGLFWPADLYLEGSDQHRGWFQTSLITSCGIKKEAPYRTVLTHGFVVDAEGRKMSKSLGNVITPQEIIKKYGAEILRIWAVAENYQQDIRISDGIIKGIVMSYRTVRNTLRYLLGNLYDFKPEDAISESEMKEVDRWAMEKTKETVKNVTDYYETFAFNKVYEEIYRLCNVSLSSFYLDHLKDRLYTYGKHSKERRSAQTALYHILLWLLRIIAPVLSFTAEEAYQCLQWEKKESVFLEDWPEVKEIDTKLLQRWERFFEIRRYLLKRIEEKREEKVIGSGLEAKVLIKAEKETLEFLNTFEGLPGLFIVSEVVLSSGSSFDVVVEKTSFGRCQRCWVHFPEIGSPQAPEICFKCQRVLKEDGIHN
ncbi:MAG: isoleucine--tRNA ligase, partial [Candidatus Ratteibacteria bacterium]|nr:isoleucine--tRNA ligase [Candidatus Ratteibacteria bacterium]